MLLSAVKLTVSLIGRAAVRNGAVIARVGMPSTASP